VTSWSGGLLRRPSTVLLLAVVLASAFVLGKWHERVRTETHGAASPRPERVGHPRILTTEGDWAVASLARRVDALEDGFQDPGHGGTSTSLAPADGSATRAKDSLDGRRARMANYEQALGNIAIAEATDQSWTSGVLRSVRERIASLEVPISVESARCGTTLCVLTISHKEAHAHADLFSALVEPGNTAAGFGGQALMRRHPDGRGGYRTTIYLVRPGERLPPAHS
jgi:hypothetical protein